MQYIRAFLLVVVKLTLALGIGLSVVAIVCESLDFYPHYYTRIALLLIGFLVPWFFINSFTIQTAKKLLAKFRSILILILSPLKTPRQRIFAIVFYVTLVPAVWVWFDKISDFFTYRHFGVFDIFESFFEELTFMWVYRIHSSEMYSAINHWATLVNLIALMGSYLYPYVLPICLKFNQWIKTGKISEQ